MKTKKKPKAPEYTLALKPKSKKTLRRVQARNQEKRLKLHRRKKPCKTSP